MKSVYRVVFALLFCDLSCQSIPVIPHFDASKKLVYVPLVPANAQTLAGYGSIVYPENFDTTPVEIVTWPALGWRPVVSGTGNEGGTTEGFFTMKWEGEHHFAANAAVGRAYFTGWRMNNEKGSFVVTFEANYHPDGGQMVVPCDKKPFIALLALPGDDIQPEDFKAFYFDGTFGVQIAPGVWHQPCFSVTEAMKFHDRQGKVHACIATNFPEEFGCYLAIPLPRESAGA